MVVAVEVAVVAQVVAVEVMVVVTVAMAALVQKSRLWDIKSKKATVSLALLGAQMKELDI